MSWTPKKRIVVPVDFSDSSADALKTALELVAKPSDLHVMHVLIPIDYMSPGAVIGSVTEQSREEEARKYFAEFLKKNGVSGVNVVVRIGDPGHEVTEYAKDEHADLIVVPSHGYHGVKRFLLGSVAERIIRHADCAVLVLRRRDAE